MKGDITIVKICEPKNRTLSFIQKMLLGINEEVDSNAIRIGYFAMQLSALGKKPGKYQQRDIKLF